MDTRKKPNINVPEGFTLFYNVYTNRWALRPIEGYSKKYLSKDTFTPKKDVAKKTENSENGNNSLTNAKRAKNDEFYTTLEDIVNELQHYKEHFKGKVVYCPCDKVYNLGRSEFFNYFVVNFHKLGLKKVICSQYNPVGKGVMSIYDGRGIKWEYNGEPYKSNPIDESEVDTEFFNGDGSFDSAECQKLMQECDIIVTNPPFSLFRQFIAQMISYGKQFLVIGNQNAITYKEIFPYIKNNQLWLGYNTPKNFRVPLDKVEDEKKQFEIDGVVYQTFGNICWFTNLPHKKRYEELDLDKSYNETDYPKYDNYDAIEVSKVSDIPADYDGIMGVPITFLGKYCPTQFEILWLASGHSKTTMPKELAKTLNADFEMRSKENTGNGYAILNSHQLYHRLLIRRK